MKTCSPRYGWPRRRPPAAARYMAVYNAANEEAVEAFHAGRIGFDRTSWISVAAVVEEYAPGPWARN